MKYILTDLIEPSIYGCFETTLEAPIYVKFDRVIQFAILYEPLALQTSVLPSPHISLAYDTLRFPDQPMYEWS